MIRKSQVVPADDAARTIAEAATTLREVEEKLIKAGLYDAHGKLVLARGAVAAVGVDLRSSAREVFTAARAGKDVPK